MLGYNRAERHLVACCGGLGVIWGAWAYLATFVWRLAEPTPDLGGLLRALLLWPTYVGIQIHFLMFDVPIHYTDSRVMIAALAEICGVVSGLLWGLLLVRYWRLWRSEP